MTLEEKCKRALELSEDAELPYHVGHINEANSNRMDVVSERGIIVAEDTLGEYGRFLCEASRTLPEIAAAYLALLEEHLELKEKYEYLQNDLSEEDEEILDDIESGMPIFWDNGEFYK